LKSPLAAVLRVRQPIAFDAPDDEPVSLLIFLLVPEAATQRHLEILSEIAEMLSDRTFRERLKTEGRRRRGASHDRCLGAAQIGRLRPRRGSAGAGPVRLRIGPRERGLRLGRRFAAAGQEN
jgi:hypothetical protein